MIKIIFKIRKDESYYEKDNINTCIHYETTKPKVVRVEMSINSLLTLAKPILRNFFI